MDGANVITPTIGKIGVALGEKQEMMRGAGRDRFK
jgi:hypothetical protein